MIRGIAMSERDSGHFDRNIMSERRLAHGCLSKSRRDPLLEFAVQFEPTFPYQQRQFPDANWRKPQLILGIREFPRYSFREPFGLNRAPDPNMSIEQWLHFFKASQSPRSLAG